MIAKGMVAGATPMTLTLMLALEMALVMALMPTRAVVAQARLCRRRLRVVGAGVDAGANAGPTLMLALAQMKY